MSLCFSQSLAEKEAQSRMQRTAEAQQLLMEGDVSYSAGKYAEASQQFLKAVNALPDAPATLDLRNAAVERYATATVQAATELSRKGDTPAAQRLLELVLAPNMAPTHAAALTLRDQLNDPLRTNPAITKEHAQAVDEVRRTLYEAEGFVQLGKFDMAKTMFEDVLRKDPTNKAARRGMEGINVQQSNYARAAYDQTRAQMITDVDAMWETPVPNDAAALMANPAESSAPARMRFITEKMQNMIFPAIELDGVGIEEAIDFIRQQSRQLDATTNNPAEKGLNIVLNLGSQESEIGQRVRGFRFDLKLKNVSADQVLKYICEQTRTQFNVDEFAVNIRPLGTDGAELVGRTYRVPPDFLSADSVGNAAAATNDPFADAPEEGLSARRVTAEQKLRNFGVPFPEGAKATFNGINSTLFVLNTSQNHDFVQQIVDTLAQTEPVQVVIRVTMIKVLETQLKELGFDWLFGSVGMGAGNSLFLGGGTTGSGANIDDLTIPGGNSNPVTAGNRSGNTAIPGNSIDELILRNSQGFSPVPQRAPGIIGLLANNVNDGQALMIMRGLNQAKGSDVMIRPATVTRSGQTSRIEIIQELIYATEYEPPQVPQQVGDPFGFGGGGGNPPITPAMPTAFDKRDTGVILEVSPVVSADRRYIELALQPEMITFDGFVNYGSPINSGPQDPGLGGPLLGAARTVQLTPNRILQPIFSVNRAKTNVTIADGATIILGGLVEERVIDIQDQVPVLGDLPLLGRFFQTKARQPVRKNVIMMVNVELQDPSGRPYRNR